MRALGFGGTTMTVPGAGETGIDTSYKTQSTMGSLLQVGNEWEIQLMVLLSFMLQLFLLLNGNLRRRNISGPLRVSIWLAYVGADAVAVYALGLFSQYEEKYKLGRHSFGDTLPFLFVPFLLVHLGGQDYITAFSMEDNNLWLRHLLNLGIQVALALYSFWKSIHRINYSHVLIPAIFIFVSGIIKYGERIWALRSGSRDSLGIQSERLSTRTPEQNNKNYIYSYALQTVLLARGLFVGRTVLQLGDEVQRKFENDFDEKYKQREEKLEVIVMELGMMFDLLYTKALVLQRWTSRILRCATQISMVVAFVLFIKTEKHAHNRVNVLISYTLFIGAIFTEACSVVMLIASPWTRAHLKEGSFFYWISRGFAWFLSKAIQRNKMQWLSNSMGQFNLMDCSISEKSTPTLSKVIGAFGLEKQWRILWHTKHIEAKDIVEHIVKWFDRPPQERFGPIQLGRKLNYTLSLPFEHTLHRLHIYTDLHISRHFASGDGSSHADDVVLLKEECEKLSNYMIYLMALYPSMLPVSTAAEDIGSGFPEWVRNRDKTTKLEILEEYETRVLFKDQDSACPFDRVEGNETVLKRSLEEIKEMWVRLLIYAAGKCRGELHARQLGNGGELLTFVWLLMVHHGLGDVATELSLLTSDEPGVPDVGSLVSVENGNWRQRLERPFHAFDFRRQQHSPHAEAGLCRERGLLELHIIAPLLCEREMAAVATRHLNEQFLSGENEQDEAVTLREAEQDEAGPSGEKGQMMKRGHSAMLWQ